MTGTRERHGQKRGKLSSWSHGPGAKNHTLTLWPPSLLTFCCNALKYNKTQDAEITSIMFFLYMIRQPMVTIRNKVYNEAL